jgi:hypothetical protein
MGKYFTIKELTNTSVQADNTPNEEQLNNLEQVIDVMDAVREEWTKVCEQNNWGNPAIKVNSGFRSKAVNDAVGGSKTSEHMLGYAVDIKPVNMKNLEFFNFIKNYLLDNKIPFSQLLNEYPINGVPSWIHLSINGLKGHRNEIKTIK